MSHTLAQLWTWLTKWVICRTHLLKCDHGLPNEWHVAHTCSIVTMAYQMSDMSHILAQLWPWLTKWVTCRTHLLNCDHGLPNEWYVARTCLIVTMGYQNEWPCRTHLLNCDHGLPNEWHVAHTCSIVVTMAYQKRDMSHTLAQLWPWLKKRVTCRTYLLNCDHGLPNDWHVAHTHARTHTHLFFLQIRLNTYLVHHSRNR